MILYPPIDLKDGQCVRLVQGDMDRTTIFNDNPLEQALAFKEKGFEWIHIVDLNGAFKGAPVNAECIENILRTVDIPIQLGGGIRDMKTAENWINMGVKRIVLGTSALKDPQFTKEACKEFPGYVAVGLDTRNGFVSTEGWSSISTVKDIELVQRFEDVGVSVIIHTDIERDGLMQGANIEATIDLARQTTIPFIASGGISSINDLKLLKEYQNEGIAGVISGRAIYENTFDINFALDLLRN